jgi:adenosine deaminase
VVGPESVWRAIKTLNAERIGHGVRSAEDAHLLEYLAEKHIPLEVNPTSNIALGVYRDYEQHSLPVLLAAGIPITINSDDPPLFNTTLNNEVSLLHSAFHLDLETINDILLNGVRYSFLPAERKAELLTEFEQELRVLQARYDVGMGQEP